MRDIKFRVWNRDKRCFYHSNHTIGINNENKTIWGDAELFTGLKDKNGNEIYEGDIIEHPYQDWESPMRYPVVFQYGRFGIEPDEILLEMKYTEIIGNIHEHPELLKP